MLSSLQAGKLLLAAFVGSYLLDRLSPVVVVATLVIPMMLLVVELIWANVRKRLKKLPVTGFGKSLVKLVGWAVEGVLAGEFFAVGYTLVVYIPKVDNAAIVFLGVVGLVAIFLVVALAVYAVKVVEDALAFIDQSSRKREEVSKKAVL